MRTTGRPATAAGLPRRPSQPGPKSDGENATLFVLEKVLTPGTDAG
ncbi:hypothetical protein [Amycolatopsis sp. NPDC021455]